MTTTNAFHVNALHTPQCVHSVLMLIAPIVLRFCHMFFHSISPPSRQLINNHQRFEDVKD